MRNLFMTLAGLCLAINLLGQSSFDEKFTSAGNIGLTINNFGVIGNSFNGSYDVLGYPSCEYPRNSGIEHLFDGGLWIGARINNSTIAVTTGAVDASTGYTTGRAGYEFSAAVGQVLTERSSLFDSPNYNPDAISHQDLIAEFSDSSVFVPGTSIPISSHTDPLGVGVHMEAYNWDYSFANFFVILNFRITNYSSNTLDSVYLGYWTDAVVRNVNITQPGGAAFFNKGGNGYIDSLTLAYEFDAKGDTLYTQSYIGTKFLGSENKFGFQHPALNPALLGQVA